MEKIENIDILGIDENDEKKKVRKKKSPAKIGTAKETPTEKVLITELDLIPQTSMSKINRKKNSSMRKSVISSPAMEEKKVSVQPDVNVEESPIAPNMIALN